MYSNRISKFFGGPFHGQEVSVFSKERSKERYEVCCFSADHMPVIISAHYIEFAFIIGCESHKAWVYDPAQCEVVSENDLYGISPEFCEFIASCIREDRCAH